MVIMQYAWSLFFSLMVGSPAAGLLAGEFGPQNVSGVTKWDRNLYIPLKKIYVSL